MTELLNPIARFLMVSRPSPGLAASVETGTSYLVSLLVAVLVIVGLLVGGWMLVALGVKIGRSMERHTSLGQKNLLIPPPVVPDKVPVSSRIAMEPAPVDKGLPLVNPDLHQQMVRDTLTGLWTREAILDLLRREMSRSTRSGIPFGLVLAKLDHFDERKKEWGEPVSEAVLLKASEHFVEGLREYDSAGRSGAEFLLILPGWDPDNDPKRVEGLLAPIRMKPSAAADKNLQVTASIGVASFHPSADSPYAEDLLQRADMAVHAAQAAGRNRAEFAPR